MSAKRLSLRSNNLFDIFFEPLEPLLELVQWTIIGSPIQWFVKSVNLNITLLLNMKHSMMTSLISSNVSMYSTLPDGLICHLMRLYDEDFRHFKYRVEDYINQTTVIRSCNRFRFFGRIANWYRLLFKSEY